MIIKEFELKNETDYDGLFVMQQIFEHFKNIKIDYQCFIFKSNIICNLLNIDCCLNIQETDCQTLLKNNLFSAICLSNEESKIEEIILEYYNNNFIKRNSFYDEEVFGGYCLSPNAFNTISLYNIILFLHHDFQNLFLVYKAA